MDAAMSAKFCNFADDFIVNDPRNMRTAMQTLLSELASQRHLYPSKHYVNQYSRQQTKSHHRTPDRDEGSRRKNKYAYSIRLLHSPAGRRRRHRCNPRRRLGLQCHGRQYDHASYHAGSDDIPRQECHQGHQTRSRGVRYALRQLPRQQQGSPGQCNTHHEGKSRRSSENRRRHRSARKHRAYTQRRYTRNGTPGPYAPVHQQIRHIRRTRQGEIRSREADS